MHGRIQPCRKFIGHKQPWKTNVSSWEHNLAKQPMSTCEAQASKSTWATSKKAFSFGQTENVTGILCWSTGTEEEGAATKQKIQAQKDTHERHRWSSESNLAIKTLHLMFTQSEKPLHSRTVPKMPTKAAVLLSFLFTTWPINQIS